MNIVNNIIFDTDRGIVKFELPEGHLSLYKTFDCGQCFRWNQLSDGSFQGVIGEKLVIIKQISKANTNTSNDTFVTNINNENDLEYLLRYLGVFDDYSHLSSIKTTEFERKAIKYGEGIRILHQDPWEAIVSFIISQRNNIPKIKSTIDKMCRALGNRHVEICLGRKYEYYSFPTPQQIAKSSISELNSFGLGYRSEYIYKIAHDFINNYNSFINLQKSEYSGAATVEYLLQYKGIGPKVANCIALFGYNKLDMFPIDVWIQRVIDNYYGGSIDIARFGSLAGLIQQYLFYYIKFNG